MRTRQTPRVFEDPCHPCECFVTCHHFVVYSGCAVATTAHPLNRPLSVATYAKTKKKGRGEEVVTLGELMKQMESGSEPVREGDRAFYKVASASDALRAGEALGANVMIVDPPRRGLEPEVLDELCKPFNSKQNYAESKNFVMLEEERINFTNDVTTLIYVSCGFDALARDAEQLLQSPGGWMLQSATGYILFAGSDHVETVCVFERRLPSRNA